MFGSLSGIFAPGNHDSPLGTFMKPIQKATDPLSWITGGKWADWTSTDIPRATNQVLSKAIQPFEAIDKTINPVRRYVPLVDQIGNVVADKPGSAIGTAIGGYFAAPALGGAIGAGGAGAGGGGGAALPSGAGAVGYGGGVSSAGLPGIFPGASVAAPSAGSLSGASAAPGLMGAGGSGIGLGDLLNAYRAYNGANMLANRNNRNNSLGI